MNESLKEKDIEDHPYVKWLEKKVEDAEKEMRQLEKRINYLDTERKRMKRLYSQALQKIVNLKNERLELKQKIQFLWNTIPLDFNLDTVKFPS